MTPNQPPTATITAPLAGTSYAAGDTIAFAGSGERSRGRRLAGARLRGRSTSITTTTSTRSCTGRRSTSGSFTIPTTGQTAADVWYRIQLTVRDAGGLETTTYRDVLPRTAQ